MYKWHSQLVSRSSRSLARDVQVVSEGIAASLRAFSISANRAEAEKPRFTITREASGPAAGSSATAARAQRTRGASDAISALRPSAPRGIDARSLGASPATATGLRISRVDNSPEGGAPRFITPRGGAGFRGRGGPNGFRGRGGARGGMGARGGRGGQRGGRGGTARGPKPKRKVEGELEIEPPTPEYLAYMSALESGVYQPAVVGETSLETLENYVPSMGASSLQMGEIMALREHFRAITGHADNDPVEGYVHHKRYSKATPGIIGQGTLFVNQADIERVTKERLYENTRSHYAPLDPAIRDPMIKQLVGGEYPGLGQPLPNDTVGCVRLGANRNETYLSTDTQRIVEKVGSMVPIPRKTKPVATKRT